MPRGRPASRGTTRATSAASQRSQAEASDSTPEITASSSTAPAPASATRKAATRGTTSTRAASPAGRFRPKNVRRDEAARDTLARQEEQKATQRAAQELRARGRGRFRSKRSRGDTMGSRGGFGRGTNVASGPFSGFGSGGSGGGFGSSIPGRGSGSGGSSSGSKLRKPGKDIGISQGDGKYPREARVNADRLHAQTPDEDLDSEDEATMALMASRAGSVFPMGIYRREHKDTGVVVATTAELQAAENATGALVEEESLWVDEQGPARLPTELQPEEQGIWEPKTKDAVKVKKEPDAEDAMDVDIAPPLSPEETKKGKMKEIERLSKTQKTILPLDSEDKMIQSDLNLLANELGAITVTEDGETRNEGPSNKDGRLYLFQFPPLLPPLKQTPGSGSGVKNEPSDTNMTDVPVAGSTPIEIKDEDDEPAAEEEEEDSKKGFMSSLLSTGGMIGQLKVRKSGRVELDWGGRTLEMSPAAGMDFLTTAVIVEENGEQPVPGVVGGDSVGMGKVMGRFVLAPQWGEEEEWEVSPSELVVE